MTFFMKAPASPNPLPVPPSIADHRPGFPKALLFLALALLAAAIVIFAFFNARTGSAALPGTLILNISEPWDAPSGKMAPGAVAYTPSTGEARRAFGPELEGVAPLAVSSDGTRAFGLLSTLTSYGLVEVILETQQTTRSYATINAQSAFLSPAWSDNGAYAAYRIASPAETASGEPVSEVRIVTPEDGTAGRGGVTILDPGIMPVALSNDGTKLLAQDATGLVLYLLQEGTSARIEGLERSEFSTHSAVRVSGDGRFLVVADRAGNTVEAFTFDWTPTGLRSIGSIDRIGQVVVSGDSQLLLYDPAAGEALVYSLEEGMGRAGAYALTLPPNAQVIGWNKVTE